MAESRARSQLVYPISAAQIRELLLMIPSWARILPNIGDGTSFEETDLDSLAHLELIEELQNASGVEIPDDDVGRLATIADAVGYLNERLQ
jgi:acyl carrier protein